MSGRSADEWVGLGRTAILQLLEREHAAAWIEVEAKIADVTWAPLGVHVDPNHLSTARLELQREGRIMTAASTSKGQRVVEVVHLADTRRRVTAIDRAAAHKRALLSRFRSWAEGTPHHRGLIGPAGEKVVNDSLVQSGMIQLAMPGGGQVKVFLGHQLDGPLDNAGFYVPLRAGIPGAALAVPIEVKNIRDWIYPASDELHQLLDKAATLQVAQPDVPIAPILVCRRAHITAYRMAEALGFIIIQAKQQFIHAVDEGKLRELRAGLGLIDLAVENGADPWVQSQFTKVLGRIGDRTAERWAHTTQNMSIRELFALIRRESDAVARSELIDELRRVADAHGIQAW